MASKLYCELPNNFGGCKRRISNKRYEGIIETSNVHTRGEKKLKDVISLHQTIKKRFPLSKCLFRSIDLWLKNILANSYDRRPKYRKRQTFTFSLIYQIVFHSFNVQWNLFYVFSYLMFHLKIAISEVIMIVHSFIWMNYIIIFLYKN